MPTKTRNHQTGSAHIVLIVGAVLLLVTAIGWFTYNRMQYTQKVNKERALYAAADKEAKAYIDAIAEKYPGEVKNLNRCWYTSEIYKQGSLGCMAGWSLEVLVGDVKDQEAVVDFSNGKSKVLLNSDMKDTTVGNQRYVSPNYVRSLLYSKKDKKCSLVYKYKENYSNGRYVVVSVNGSKILEVSVECSGSAFAEYYK